MLFYLPKSVQGLLYLLVLVERFRKRTCQPLSDFNTTFIEICLLFILIGRAGKTKDTFRWP